MNIDFNKNQDGLVPAIVQDALTKNVLMLGYMNKDAYSKTVDTGKVTFYSRTKSRLWTKGEESGNFLNMVELKVDCDNDTLLIKAEQKGGAACHKGYESCFYRKIDGKVIDKKIFDPKEVYGGKNEK